MKDVFKIRLLPEGDTNSFDKDEDIFIVQNCMPCLDPNFWIGCAAHTLQLVIHDGVQDVLDYSSLNKALGKCQQKFAIGGKVVIFRIWPAISRTESNSDAMEFRTRAFKSRSPQFRKNQQGS